MLSESNSIMTPELRLSYYISLTYSTVTHLSTFGRAVSKAFEPIFGTHKPVKSKSYITMLSSDFNSVQLNSELSVRYYSRISLSRTFKGPKYLFEMERVRDEISLKTHSRDQIFIGST